MRVFWDGRVWEPGALPLAADRGLLLGDGLFETILVRGGVLVRLTQHLARLRRSAGLLGIAHPPDLATTVRAACDAMRGQADAAPTGCLRVTLTRGAGRGLDPPEDAPGHLLVALTPVDDRPPAAVRATVLDRPRIDPLDPLSGHKTTSALRWVLARRQARAAGADVALLRTLDGDVCEADAANVFAVLQGGHLVTPPLDRGVLPGVTRAWCLETLRAAGRPAREARLEPADLLAAQEVFLTSSLTGPRAVARIDGRVLPGRGEARSWLAACWKEG